MNYYVEALKKYFVFSGRASRREFWWFVGITAFLCFVVPILCAFILIADGGYYHEIKNYVGTIFADYELNISNGSLLYICVASFIPLISATTRRLHDTGHSGKSAFLALIPIFGIIVIICFLVQKSTAENNIYGDVPPEINDRKTSIFLKAFEPRIFWKIFAAIALACAVALCAMYLHLRENHVGYW
ncbi:MAG: DUF805 domain-containing protein [Chitinispirillia bacterium]|nr:DUF805 domain-containing protein [Chitinispirillia bacterium]MCL2269164.1 DUF805 domain-containing protein [Chitinispirillia bacterium]